MTIGRLQTILLDKINENQTKQMTKMKLKNLSTTSNIGGGGSLSNNQNQQGGSSLMFLDDLNAGDVATAKPTMMMSANDEDEIRRNMKRDQPIHEFVRQLVVEGELLLLLLLLFFIYWLSRFPSTGFEKSSFPLSSFAAMTAAACVLGAIVQKP